MRKNDEQKTNKLKKEKVKKEKTKKIPKRDNASRKEKKIKMKESSGGQKKEKSEIPFYRSIAMRLVGAFLIPVIGVLVLLLTIMRPMPLWIHTKNLYSRLLIRCSSISIWLSRVRRTNLRPI